MAIEIERKFLLQNDNWREQGGQGIPYRQGYLAGGKFSSVRARIEGDQANLNIKSGNLTIRRTEYEYPIPLKDAQEILDNLCPGGVIEKTRYRVPHAGHIWEIDVFAGNNQGLVVAEIELQHEDEDFERPDWLGEEVSDDPRYYNVNLIASPYKDW